MRNSHDHDIELPTAQSGRVFAPIFICRAILSENESETDYFRPVVKLNGWLPILSSERSELVATAAGVWGRSPQWGPGAKPLVGG